MQSRYSWLGLAAAAITVVNGQTPVQFNPNPSRVVGHAKVQLITSAPNLVEGREFYGPQGVAVDTSATPNVLYVADSNNNRVLVFRNARAGIGAKADAVIGQADFLTTVPLGPGTSSQIGLRNPSGIAVDRRGNLYVLDSGNNRILRYQRPYEPRELIQPNFVIGQTSFNANQANQGNSSPSAKSLAFVSGSSGVTGSIYFDSNGNLWVTDGLNSRVLRFPASALTDSSPNAPEADLVIGQADFGARQTVDWFRPESRLLKTAIQVPNSMTLDAAGRLYVTDGSNRMLVYTPPLRSGMAAARIAGVYFNVQGQPPRPPVNEYTLFGPEGVIALGNTIFVADAQVNRIVRFDPFDTWPEETPTLPSPPAKAVFGQPDLLSFRSNRGNREPSNASFAAPTAFAVANDEVFIADTLNHRVLAAPINPTSIGGALRVLGQIGFTYRSPNLVEGREMFLLGGSVQYNYQNVFPGAGVVIDRAAGVPHLYVADTYNNRILAYNDARTVKPGDVADLVIGQSNLFETKQNSPADDIDTPTDQGLVQPIGVAVDSNGDLWVADSGNGRVLRFAKPFDSGQKFGQRANLVIGQSGFNIKITDATRFNMSKPYGLAFTVEGHLMVSDIAHHRVLLFRKNLSGQYASGQQASVVFGQRDFNSSTVGGDETRFALPTHIATDTDDRLYVADTGNRRVAIFDRVLSAPNNAPPAVSLVVVANQNDRLGLIQGLTVSPRTGEIWVADTNNNRVVRYPRFDSLALSPNANYQINSQAQPLAITTDSADNLLIADSTNRVAFYYPGLAAVSAAHYLRRRVSPGMVAALYPAGIRFGEETSVFSSLPLPKDLADVEVLVNEQPAPLYFVSPTQINFYVPMGLEPGSQAEFIVQRKSTRQILASGLLDIGVATPSFFTTTQNGQGQVAAINEDGSINTNTNGVDRGKVIQLFATGQGFVPGAPPDGEAPTGAVATPQIPVVVIGSSRVADDAILYSGLAPGLVGVWQLNVRVPMSVPPGSATDVVVSMRSVPSNQPEGGGGVIRTVIAVK